MIKRLLLCLFIMLYAISAQAEIKRYEVPVGDSPSLGPETAPITIIEFIDFQ
jgi:hypothetical protein